MTDFDTGPAPTLYQTPARDVQFDARIERQQDGCWVWTGERKPKGYGVLNIGNRREVSAHRYSYERFKGPIPAGLFVCHTCDNPPCVNPDHLWVGTNSENILDSYRHQWVLVAHDFTTTAWGGTYRESFACLRCGKPRDETASRMGRKVGQTPTPERINAAVPNKVLLTTEEAAFSLGYSERFLRVLTKEGRIPCVRVGDTVRYRPAALEQFAADNERREEESREAPNRGVGLPKTRRKVGSPRHGRPRDSERPQPAGVVRAFPGGGRADAG